MTIFAGSLLPSLNISTSICYLYIPPFVSTLTLRLMLTINLNCLTFNVEVSGCMCLATSILSLDLEFTGIFVEDFRNIQGVNISLLDNLEVWGAHNLGALSEPCDNRGGATSNSYSQFDRFSFLD